MLFLLGPRRAGLSLCLGSAGHLLECLYIKHTHALTHTCTHKCRIIHILSFPHETRGDSWALSPDVVFCSLLSPKDGQKSQPAELQWGIMGTVLAFSLHCRLLSLFLQKVMFVLICVVTLLVILGIILATALS